MTLKEKLGFGSLKNEDELMAHDLTKAAKPKSRFDDAMSSILTNMLMRLVVPWINSCFAKYSEKDFHIQMETGFNFIEDWKRNHPERFGKFIRTARAFRHRFEYNQLSIYNEVMVIFERKEWRISNTEKVRLMDVILRLKEMIYAE